MFGVGVASSQLRAVTRTGAGEALIRAQCQFEFLEYSYEVERVGCFYAFTSTADRSSRNVLCC